MTKNITSNLVDEDCIFIITTGAHCATLFLGPQIRFWVASRPVIVAGSGPYAKQSCETFIEISITRKPNLFQDLRTLYQLIRHLRKRKPKIVLTLMPKAGLLGQMAGFLTGVPTRVHVFTGQVWASKTGSVRQILVWFDKLIAKLATHLLTDGHSQKSVIVEAGIAPAPKINVPGHGSICGVDTKRFYPDATLRSAERHGLNFTNDDFLFLFLGRLANDKGVGTYLDLAEQLKDMPGVHFLLVGQDDDNWQPKISALRRAGVNVRYLGYRLDCENILRAVDVMVLPSLREGFGSVVIEAGACAIPVITTDVYGLKDSVQDGVNGLTYPVGDTQRLVKLAQKLATNAGLCRTLGRNGRTRALSLFNSDYVVKRWDEYFNGLPN